MLLHPDTVAAQAPTLAALDQAAGAYPVCEAWISVARTLAAAIPAMDARGLRRAGAVALSVAKALGWVQSQIPQEQPAVSYISALAVEARRLGTMAALAALAASGTQTVQLSIAAVSALEALQAWDDAQGFYKPSNPAVTALQLVQGVMTVA